MATIRVMAIFENITKFAVNCHFQDSKGTFTKWRALNVSQMWQENFGAPFTASYVICPILAVDETNFFEYPMNVGITYDKFNDTKILTNLVRIRYPSNYTLYVHPKVEMVVCAGPLQNNFSNSLRLVEYFEIYKILGATKFYIYNDSITTSVDRVLRHYQKEKTVEVFQWKLEKSDFGVGRKSYLQFIFHNLFRVHFRSGNSI